jgi:Sec-independent protein translocase protein TatA
MWSETMEMHMLGEIFGVDGIVVVVVLAVVLFGGAAIPKLARNLGSAKNQFEKGLDEGKKASTPAAVNVVGQSPEPSSKTS